MTATPLLETAFTLGDRTFHVRPTLRIVRRLETIGSPLAIARSLLQGEVGLVAMANLLLAILRDEKHCPTAEGLQEILFEHGLADQVAPLSEFLGRCWVGNRRAAEAAERQAAEEREREEAAAGDPPSPSH
jgi:hypothetical protein